MTIIRAARRRAGRLVRAVRGRWPSPPPTVERRLAELEATTADLKSTLAKVTVQARDAQRLSREDGRALQFALLDINEIRRDLDAVLEGEQP